MKHLNLFLLIDIEMIMKLFVIFGLFVFLIIGIGAEDVLESLDIVEEASIQEYLEDSLLKDILLSNATYNIGTRTLTMNEGGSLKILIRDEEEELHEFVYENVKEGGMIKLDGSGEIIKAEFIVNENGGVYVFGNAEIYAPPNSEVFFDAEKGTRIKIPENGKLNQIPLLKNILGLSEYITVIEGKNIEFPGGEILNGTLNFVNGQAYLDTREEIEINNIKIKNEYLSPGITNIFFDGKKHEGKYVSFGKENIILASARDELGSMVEFKEGNPYLNIEEGDYFAIRPWSDEFDEEGSEIEIQNRDEEGFIPKVISKHGSHFNLQEDSKSIFTSELFGMKRIYLTNSPNLNKEIKDSTTSPIELVILGEDNDNWLGKFSTGDKIKGHKIFVDNFNRIAVVPEGAEEALVESEGVDTKFSSRIRYNYLTKNDLLGIEDIPIVWDGEFPPTGTQQRLLGRLRDYYGTLTPETKDAITQITFSDGQVFEETFGENWEMVAAAYAQGRKITFREDDRLFDLDTFRHESAHARHYNIETEGKGLLIPLIEERRRLHNTLDKASSDEEKEIIRGEIDDVVGKYSVLFDNLWDEQQRFRKEWREFAEGELDEIGIWKSDKCRKNSIGYWEYKNIILWYIGYSGAHEGFVRPYGCANIKEDIATYVGKINEPEFFKNLINPKSIYYNERYRKKIDLLYEYKLISEGEYDRILEVAGVE